MSESYRKQLRFYFLSAAPSLFFLVGIFIPKGSVILLSLAGIMVITGTMKSEWRTLFRLNAAWNTIALFICLSTVSAIWSLTPANTLYKVLPLIAMGLLALIVVNFSMSLINDEIEALKKGIIFGGFLGFILLGLELTGEALISRFLITSFSVFSTNTYEMVHIKKTLNSGVTIASLFFWPWLFVVWAKFKYYISIPILTGSVMVILLGANDAPFFAVTAGLLSSTIVVLNVKIGRAVLTILVLIGIFIAPLAPKYLFSFADSDKGKFVAPSTFVTFDKGIIPIPNAWYHRLTVWKVTSERIEQKPFLGYGYDTSRALYKKGDEIRYQRYDKSGNLIVGIVSEPIPLHPHNVVLQIWLEMGIAGAIFLAALLFFLIKSVFGENLNKRDRFAGVGILVTIFIINLISYGAWQNWWLGSQIIVIFIFTCLVFNRTKKLFTNNSIPH